MKKNMKESKLNTLLDSEIIDLRLSYSKVSDFDRNGPICFVRPENISNTGMRHGSLTETLLCDKLLGTDNFNKEYILINITKPTATLGALVDIILSNYMEVPSKETVLNIINNNDFFHKYLEETKIKKFDIPEFWEYIKLNISANDRIIVNQEEYDRALNASETLLNHPFSKDLFYNDYENHYQVKISYYYKGFKFKGFIDKVTIDRTNKKVYFEDIKTGEPKSIKFMESFIKYRYYLQGLIYQKSFQSLEQQFNLEGYELMPFKFIYLSKFESHPLIYTMTSKWEESALKGYKTTQGYVYKGLSEIVDNIYYHWKNNKYEYSKEIYDLNGSINLNDNFIIPNE